MKNLFPLIKISFSCSVLLVLSSFTVPYIPNNCEFSAADPILSRNPVLRKVSWYAHIGDLYADNKNKYLKSFQFVILAKYYTDEHNLQHHPVNASICARLGGLYYYYGDYQKSIRYFTEWHKQLYKCENDIYSHYLAFGLAYHHLGKFAEAHKYMSIGLFYARFLNKKDWVGIIAGNLGENYASQGKIKQAMKYYAIDFYYARKYDNYISQITTLLDVASIHSAEGNWTFFEKWEPEIQRLMVVDRTKPLPEYFKIKSEYYESKGDANMAIVEYKKFQRAKDSITSLKSKAKIIDAEFQIFEKNALNQIGTLDTYNQKKNNYIRSLIFSLLFTFGTLAIFIYKQTRKTRKIKQEYARRKTIVDNELLAYSQKISTLEKEISKKNQSENGIPTIIEKIREMKILTSEDWAEFRKTFQLIYPNFIDTLVITAPKLTEGEKRLCCLIRLNLPTKEIAATIGVSHDSVQKNLLRLKNKFNFSTQHELRQFIFSIPVE